MKEKLWNGNYWKVMIANFTLFFAFYLLTPLLPLYLSEQFHATKDVIGVVLSGYTVMALLSRPFSGYLVDTFNRKTVLIVCFFLFFIFFAGYLAASTLLLFTIVRTLHGAPFGSVTVANSTMAIDVLPSSRRNEGIGYYGLSNNLAMAIAPTAGLFIYHEIHNFELLFWLALLIAGIGLLVDASLSPCPSPAGRGEKESLPYGGRLEGAPCISLDRFFLINGWMLASRSTWPLAARSLLQTVLAWMVASSSQCAAMRQGDSLNRRTKTSFLSTGILPVLEPMKSLIPHTF